MASQIWRVCSRNIPAPSTPELVGRSLSRSSVPSRAARKVCVTNSSRTGYCAQHGQGRCDIEVRRSQRFGHSRRRDPLGSLAAYDLETAIGAQTNASSVANFSVVRRRLSTKERPQARDLRWSKCISKFPDGRLSLCHQSSGVEIMSQSKVFCSTSSGEDLGASTGRGVVDAEPVHSSSASLNGGADALKQSSSVGTETSFSGTLSGDSKSPTPAFAWTPPSNSAESLTPPPPPVTTPRLPEDFFSSLGPNASGRQVTNIPMGSTASRMRANANRNPTYPNPNITASRLPDDFFTSSGGTSDVKRKPYVSTPSQTGSTVSSLPEDFFSNSGGANRRVPTSGSTPNSGSSSLPENFFSSSGGAGNVNRSPASTPLPADFMSPSAGASARPSTPLSTASSGTSSGLSTNPSSFSGGASANPSTIGSTPSSGTSSLPDDFLSSSGGQSGQSPVKRKPSTPVYNPLTGGTLSSLPDDYFSSAAQGSKKNNLSGLPDDYFSSGGYTTPKRRPSSPPAQSITGADSTKPDPLFGGRSAMDVINEYYAKKAVNPSSTSARLDKFFSENSSSNDTSTSSSSYSRRNTPSSSSPVGSASTSRFSDSSVGGSPVGGSSVAGTSSSFQAGSSTSDVASTPYAPRSSPPPYSGAQSRVPDNVSGGGSPVNPSSAGTSSTSSSTPTSGTDTRTPAEIIAEHYAKKSITLPSAMSGASSATGPVSSGPDARPSSFGETSSSPSGAVGESKFGKSAIDSPPSRSPAYGGGGSPAYGGGASPAYGGGASPAYGGGASPAYGGGASPAYGGGSSPSFGGGGPPKFNPYGDIPPDREIDNQRIFIGGLSFYVKANELKAALLEACGKHGNVLEVELGKYVNQTPKSEEEGKHRGFAFVKMSTPEEAQLVIEKLNSQFLCGRRMTVSYGLKKSEPARSDGPVVRNKVFVGNLHESTSEEQLQTAFSRFGEIEETKIVTDLTTMASRGFGFVTFVNEEAAQKAILDLDGSTLDGSVIRVNIAKYPQFR